MFTVPDMAWNTFHVLLAVGYVAALAAAGILASRRGQDSKQFLNATGTLPLWVCVVAAIAANCGSLDVIAMMGLGAQYGMLACHFYWIGAIPALLVLTFWLLPAYARGRYPTILDFIAQHYGRKTWLAVSLAMSAMMLLLAGVCLCAAAQVLTSFLGWTFLEGILLVAPLVFCYTWAGGLRATLYTELIHFVMVLAAVVPLFVLLVRDFGGIHPLLAAIPAQRLHVWNQLPTLEPAAPMDRFGVIAGLGVVLSFGYWGTDFILMQRALAVGDEAKVRYVPLALSGAKLVFAMLIVLPGVAAPLVLHRTGIHHWNATLPEMMAHYYSPTWMLIGVMGLSASLVATFANNVSGFSSAWVQGVYRPWIRPDADETHYLRVGRMTIACAVVLSIGAAYFALQYASLMEYMQMIFATFNAPIFALVALAAIVPARVSEGGFGGLLLGTGCAALHQILVRAGLLHYGSRMSANFYAAVLAFVVALASTLAIHRMQGHGSTTETSGTQTIARKAPVTASSVLLALSILFVCGWFNWYFQ